MSSTIVHTLREASPLGIIMLDTQFHRPLGDVGNPASWPFPVIIERVSHAYAREVVNGAFDTIQPFLNASINLRQSGCIGIISTCGFLARFPKHLFNLNDVVISPSTLHHYKHLADSMAAARKRVAIITICASSIDAQIRRHCAIPADAIVVSPSRNGHFCRAILDGGEPLQTAIAERELVEVAATTQHAHPNIGLWLFECANIPPYREAVERATGVPVYDALQMGIALHASVNGRAA